MTRRYLQLSLSARGRHGGYRANAGRPKGRSSHYVPHVRRPKLSKHQAVHVTVKLVDGLPNLRRPIPTGIIQWVMRAERRRKGFRLVHYSVRRNHLHLICEGNHPQALSRGVQRLGSRIARRLNRHWQRRGRVFADRFHEHVVATPRAMRNVLRYVLLNEHKDALPQGRIVIGTDPYSSSSFFDGWADVDGCIDPGRDPPRAGEGAGPPVTAPESWLLRRGWRRHGLLGTTELRCLRRARS